MHVKFVPPISDLNATTARLVEELGELLAAVGKTGRYGYESVSPLLPPEKQERNGDWVMRELDDAEDAIRRMRASVIESGFVPVYAGGGR